MHNTALALEPELTTTASNWFAPVSSRDDLVRQGLPLVRAIAERLRRRYTLTMPFEDLCAMGVTGLMMAANRFDPSRNVSFVTFAYHKVRGAILDGLRRSDRQYSFEMRRRLAAERRADEHLVGEAQRSTTRSKLTVGRSLDEIATTLSDIATIHLASMGTSAEDATPDPAEAAHQRWVSRRIQQAVARLPQKEREVIELYYYGDDSFGDVAEKLGMSRPWAFRLHKRALCTLRQALGELAEELAA